VLYARRDSALARLDAAALDAVLDRAVLGSARVLHLTGITPALGEGCRRAWLASAQRARAAGAQVSLDVNFRAKLWSPQQCREALEAVLPHVTVLFSGLRDLRLLFDAPADPEQAARTLAAAYRLPLVVVTLGTEGALAYDAVADVLRRAPSVPTEVLDRIGAGDAFAAGFLHGWLGDGPSNSGDVAHGLRCGNALAALKQTWRGDASWATRGDLEALLAQHDAPDARRVER
jgi:2-dehydro-3-deoxygluconokinase